MVDTHLTSATRALEELADGDRSAADRLIPLVYAELRAMAGGLFRRQTPDQTLQPTALVHEAFVRLIDRSSPAYQDRAHFMAVAATAMRQILADHARRRQAAKRGGKWGRVTLSAVKASPAGEALDMIAVDAALRQLATLDERKHRIVEMRFFGGLTVEEIADVLGVSKTTVESDWRAARAWLGVQLSPTGPS